MTIILNTRELKKPHCLQACANISPGITISLSDFLILFWHNVFIRIYPGKCRSCSRYYNLINQGPMKRILLLAAVHVLIIHQSNKDARGKIARENSRKAGLKKEQTLSRQDPQPVNHDLLTAVFTNDASNMPARKPALRQ